MVNILIIFLIKIGSNEILLEDGEDIVGFFKNVYKELQLKKTTLSDLFAFVCAYLKPANSIEYSEALDNVKDELINEEDE